MELTAEAVRVLIDEFARLPGIGRKSAARLAYHILRSPSEEALLLSQAIKTVKERIRECSICFNYAEAELCPVCASQNRDTSVICVVEKPADIIMIERSGSFKGRYHVLGGALSPIDGITPEKLNINALLNRIDKPGFEVILSTGTSTEGEHTALYLVKLLKAKGAKVSRIARGLPAGSDLQYMDEITMLRAMEGRVEI
ncbi:MAG: recombination protein RecR [Fibrobacteres bacterium]|nr:recombination protein RecR [Fibrobacterota bacterium]